MGWSFVVSMSFLCPGGVLVPLMSGSCHSWNSTFRSSSQKMQMQGFGLGTWADPELVLPSIVVPSSSLVCCWVGSTFVLLGTMVNLDSHQPSSIFCLQVPTYEIHVDGYRLVEELNDIYN
jgi:hypothetical protein